MLSARHQLIPLVFAFFLLGCLAFVLVWLNSFPLSLVGLLLLPRCIAIPYVYYTKLYIIPRYNQGSLTLTESEEKWVQKIRGWRARHIFRLNMGLV